MVLQKSDLPVDATSFCRATFSDMADKQPITAQRKPMLTLENGEVLEGIRKFCYLGDRLNGGGSRLASISRIGCDWKKFRELSGILTRR